MLLGLFTFDKLLLGYIPLRCLITYVCIIYSLVFRPQQCNSDVCVCSQTFPSLELRPLVEAAYRRHFFQKEHWTYYTEEPDLGPCVLSLKPEADGTVYRCVVITHTYSTCCKFFV